MLCALMMSSVVGFAINSNAASTDTLNIEKSGNIGNVDVCMYYVSNESSLRSALKRAVDEDWIIFTENITCQGDLKVASDVTLDFSGHSLKFVKSVHGLVIAGNTRVNLKSGDIYANEDSDSAVSIRSGDVNFKYMRVYGGNCSGYGTEKNGGHYWKYYGNAVYCKPDNNNVFVNGCYFQGGNGYSKGIFNSSRTGKAVYGVNILYVGTDGDSAVNGEYR